MYSIIDVCICFCFFVFVFVLSLEVSTMIYHFLTCTPKSNGRVDNLVSFVHKKNEIS